MYSHDVNLLKIKIINQKIDDIALIAFKENVKILGAYDMNMDNFIDILYADQYNNVK
jgi:hypothetical protein